MDHEWDQAKPQKHNSNESLELKFSLSHEKQTLEHKCSPGDKREGKEHRHTVLCMTVKASMDVRANNMGWYSGKKKERKT